MYNWIKQLVHFIVLWTGVSSTVNVTVTDVQVNVTTVGDPVTLGCQYTLGTASNSALIRWYKVDSSGEKLVYTKLSTVSFGTAGSGYSGKVTLNGASITFLYTNKTDAGTYNCTVQDRTTRESGISQVYMMIKDFPEMILVERMGSADLKENDKLQLTVSTTNGRPLVNHHCTLGGQSLTLIQPAVYNVTDPVFDPLYGTTTSQLEIKVKSKDSDQQVQCCVADSNLCENFTVPSVSAPKETPKGYGWLAGGLGCLACQVILDVAIYKKCKGKLVTGLGWLAVIASLVFVIMGDVCGIMAGIYIFPGNDTEVVGIVIAVSCGFFLLGVGLGVMIGHGIWKLSQDEKLNNIIKKLRHIVLSVATFGGEVVGIYISFKIWGKKITDGGKHKEHRRNSVAPEEIAELGCRSDSAHSEGSIASHSKVPLQGANEQGPGKEDKQMEKGAKKKKKKKKTGTQSQEVSCQGNSPRKLPPLRR